MTTPTVWVRNAALERVGEADDETRQVKLIPRLRNVGTWELSIPYDTRAAALLLEDGAGIIVEDELPDGTVGTILSGPRGPWRRQWSPDGDRLVAYGVDDLVWVSRRIAHPSPADGNVATQAYDVRTDVASTVILEYVDANAGPSALVDRRVTGLALAADPAVGAAVTGRARFDNLLELISALAVAGGDLAFRIVQAPDTETLTFEVYAPADRTGAVIFAEEYGNLAGFETKLTPPQATYAYVLGSGEGVARTVVEGGDAAGLASWGRLETAVDRRDTADLTELGQARDTTLAEAAEALELTLKPIDTDAVTYRVDYDLGDKVSVVVDGVTTEEVIRELEITLDPRSGVRIVPAVTGQRGSTLLRLFEELAELRRRVAGLERRP